MQWVGLEKQTDTMHRPLLVVGGGGGGGLWWVFSYLKIYIYSILINYPDYVQCAIINPTTFLFKADFLIWLFYYKAYNAQTKVQIHSKTGDQIFHVLVEQERN